jgi:hypothetical protein
MSSTNQTSEKFNAKTIVSIGEKLHLNENSADFHFNVKKTDGTHDRIAAHKLLLRTASDVFDAMFSGAWEDNDEVEIVDASPAEFREFLQFFYLEEVNVTMPNAIKVMYLADKYNVPECLSVCKQFLLKTLTSDNICLGYELAILLDDKELTKFCEESISRNAIDVLTSSNFLECDKRV